MPAWGGHFLGNQKQNQSDCCSVGSMQSFLSHDPIHWWILASGSNSRSCFIFTVSSKCSSSQLQRGSTTSTFQNPTSQPQKQTTTMKNNCKETKTCPMLLSNHLAPLIAFATSALFTIFIVVLFHSIFPVVRVFLLLVFSTYLLFHILSVFPLFWVLNIVSIPKMKVSSQYSYCLQYLKFFS